MIEWMQRHRKYLVVTIWISTIAFVGAGFVGWGAYSLGSDKASAIAKVGNRNISVRQFQTAYSNTYGYYNNLLNGQLTKEKAEQMGLEKNVIQNLINETLLLNYADELGLHVRDEDIKEKLANDKTFQKDGVFNLKQYKMVLKNIGLSGNEYDKILRREILLSKLMNILKLQPNKDLENLLSSALFMKDKLSIKILHADKTKIDLNDEKLQKFWEPMKDRFKTQKTYEILSDFVSFESEMVNDEEIQKYYEEKKFNFLGKDGKVQNLEDAKEKVIKELKAEKARKTALRKYLDIKNKKVTLTNKSVIKDTDTNYPLDKLASANHNEVIKPFKQKDGYVVVVLAKTNLPQTMTFAQAKENVKTLYEAQEIQNLLTNEAKKTLTSESFDGVETGYISRDVSEPIKGLGLDETKYFANKVFSSNKQKDFVIMGEKAVLYKIISQKLLDNEKIKKNKEQVSQMAQQLEENQLRTNLLKKLSKRYKIEQYYKGK